MIHFEITTANAQETQKRLTKMFPLALVQIQKQNGDGSKTRKITFILSGKANPADVAREIQQVPGYKEHVWRDGKGDEEVAVMAIPEKGLMIAGHGIHSDFIPVRISERGVELFHAGICLGCFSPGHLSKIGGEILASR